MVPGHVPRATVRKWPLTDCETTSSIVFYFSMILPASYHFRSRGTPPTAGEIAALILDRHHPRLSHFFLTESYRYALASVVAPLGYMSLLWAFFFGYAYAGAAVVTGCGPFVIWRERSLGTREKPRRKI